ncbi:MAG: helix-turn-helix domain-containing protein [Actinobacteria bacterium]|nr:helix-turn-helix domain-containing protein [Actinomycetota bacterium]
MNRRTADLSRSTLDGEERAERGAQSYTDLGMPSVTGSLIKTARQAAGLSQAEVADRAGTSQPAVARYEAGLETPTLPTLERLLRASGCGLQLEAVPLAAGVVPISSVRGQTGPLAAKLRQRRPALLEAIRRRGANNARIFGSVARGEDRDGSDVDLLVELSPERSLVDLAGLQMEISQILGEPVDVATPDMLKPRVLAIALREGVPL